MTNTIKLNKTINVLIIITFLFFISCSEEKDAISNSSSNPINNTSSISRPLPIGDLNLNAKWDWTVSTWKDIKFKNPSGTIGTITTLNPFIDGTQKIYGNTNTAVADMKPSQGWVLVARDFGTSKDANTYPFVLLYNKYRGVLRVCILRTYDSLTSYQRISLSFSNGSYAIPNIFKYASNSSNFPADTNQNLEFSQTAITKSGVNQWMIAEFNVMGYQAVIDPNAAINIDLAEIVDSSITLSGTINLDGTAEPQVQEKSLNFWSGLKSVGSFVSGIASPTSKLLNLPAKTWEEIKTIKDLAKNKEITSASGDILQKIAGFVNGFIGGGSGGTAYNIKLNGTINQTGTIQTVIPKTSFTVYLNKVNVASYRALNTINWGIFDIKSDISTQYKFIFDRDDRCARYGKYYAKGFLSNNLIVNPAIKSDIVSIEACKIYKYQDVVFVPLQDFDKDLINTMTACIGPNGRDTYFPIKLGVKFTFKDGSVVYQTIPLR